MFYSVFNRRFNLDQEAAIICMSETRLTCAERERDKAREKRLSQKKNKFCLTTNYKLLHLSQDNMAARTLILGRLERKAGDSIGCASLRMRVRGRCVVSI